MTREEKTENWKKSIKKTKEKRKHQVCRVFKLKLDKDKLTQAKLAYFNLLFEDAKLVYNHILSLPDVFQFDSKVSQVNALDKDRNPIVKDLSVISSQMKQSIHRRIISSIKSLSTKKRSEKVGKVKFRSNVNSITFDQFGMTYKLDDKFLKIQGCKKMRFKVLGMHQLPAGADIANAIFIYKNNNFYLNVTTFVPKVNQEVFSSEIVGIDAGCSTTLALSDSTKYNVKFPVSKKTKKLQRKLKNKPSHKVKIKKSKNCLKLYGKINKSKDKTFQQKKDKTNKIVSEITKKHKIICVQKENVKGWKSKHGKAVQSSSVGGIMVALCNKAHTLIEVEMYYPSTQICSKCGNRQHMGIRERIYNCLACKTSIDRDFNSSINMLLEGKKQLPTGRRDVKPMELLSSAGYSKSVTMK